MNDFTNWADPADAAEGGTGLDPAPQELDLNHDGVVDALLVQLDDGSWAGALDHDGDLGADVFVADVDIDGNPELMISEEAEGGYRIRVDNDSDGVVEVNVTMTREELVEAYPGAVEFLDVQFGDGAAQAPADLVVDGQLVGDPQGASEHWFEQAANGFCVPSSIAQIVSEYTGVHFGDEQHFVERANALGIFTVGPDGVPGVTVDGAEALLEDAGIPAEAVDGLSVDNLVGYLDEGRGIMLAIDSGEIWYGEDVEDQAADHAVVLTGFDLDRGVAILSDPGSPTGDEFELPISALEDAWADSGYAALICDTPPGDMPAEDFAPVNVAVPADAAPRPADQGSPTGFDPVLLPAGDDVTGPAEEKSQIKTAVDWLVQHPYAVIPVLVGAGAIVSRK